MSGGGKHQPKLHRTQECTPATGLRRAWAAHLHDEVDGCQAVAEQLVALQLLLSRIVALLYRYGLIQPWQLILFALERLQGHQVLESDLGANAAWLMST